MTKTYYIGLDVHKDSIAIAYALEGSRKDAIYHGTCGGTNLAAERALRKLAEKLGVKLQEMKICYEAGPTGFVLARRLLQLKVECMSCRPPKPSANPTSELKPTSEMLRKSRNSSATATSQKFVFHHHLTKRCAIFAAPAPTQAMTYRAQNNASAPYSFATAFATMESAFED